MSNSGNTMIGWCLFIYQPLMRTSQPNEIKYSLFLKALWFYGMSWILKITVSIVIHWKFSVSLIIHSLKIVFVFMLKEWGNMQHFKRLLNSLSVLNLFKCPSALNDWSFRDFCGFSYKYRLVHYNVHTGI